MLDSYVNEPFGGQYTGLKAVDLASHQGYFAVKTAELGFAEVLGIDCP
jgi:2-polyprenyl-3-methyl-5-hydroxy-6-metoxy-1,4-benzoquinol methylase